MKKRNNTIWYCKITQKNFVSKSKLTPEETLQSLNEPITMTYIMKFENSRLTRILPFMNYTLDDKNSIHVELEQTDSNV